jgi:hypothetical protein
MVRLLSDAGPRLYTMRFIKKLAADKQSASSFDRYREAVAIFYRRLVRPYT